MIIVKSIGLGLLFLIIGQLTGFILSVIVGIPVEAIAKKVLSASKLKRFTIIWGYAWIGFTIGMIYSSLIFFFKINGWILSIIFIIYFSFFLFKKNGAFIFHELCDADVIQYKKLLRTIETITFIVYIFGFYGLWTLLVKWN